VKTKIIFTISIAAAFLVGFVTGGVRSTSSWVRWNNQNVYRGYASDAFIYSVALTHLRNGHEKEGINVLENSLECSLCALGNDYKALAKQPDDSIFQDIKTARDYRTKYPWDGTNLVIAAQVEKVLSLGK
jgi:hypothetical protein